MLVRRAVIVTLLQLGFQAAATHTSAIAQILSPQGNPLSTTITINRSSGVAPLALIADLEVGTRGLRGDFVNASFVTDFDSDRVSPTTSPSVKGGFLAGHVYERSGRYRISSSVLDILGNRAEAEAIHIDVQDPEVFYASNTYCFSTTANPSFSGCPTSDPRRRIVTDNMQQALDMGGTNRRLLFSRQGTWQASTVIIRPGGGQTIGAFPAPGSESLSKPRLISTASNHAFALLANDLRDLKIMDFHIVGSWTPAMTSSPNLSGISVDGSENVLVYRVVMEGLSATGFYTGFRSRNVALANSIIRDSRDYGGYGGANGLLVIDNVINNLHGTQHGFRVQGGQNSIFYGNEFTNLRCYTSITPRGHNWKTVIANNLLHQIVAPNPQNSTSYEIVGGVLIEGNRIEPPAISKPLSTKS